MYCKKINDKGRGRRRGGERNDDPQIGLMRSPLVVAVQPKQPATPDIVIIVLLNAPWYATAPPFESQTSLHLHYSHHVAHIDASADLPMPPKPSGAISLVPVAKRYGCWIGMNESIDSIRIFGSLAEDAEVWADFFNKGVKQQKDIFPFCCQKFGT